MMISTAASARAMALPLSITTSLFVRQLDSHYGQVALSGTAEMALGGRRRMVCTGRTAAMPWPRSTVWR